MQDFIDSRLVITANSADKIGKDRMRSLYLQMFPDKHITTLQIISELKDRKLVYNKDMRDNHVKGCFINVKERSDSEIMDEDVKDENQMKIEQQAKQIEELLLKLKALEDDNTKLKSVVKMKTTLETEPEIVEVVVKELETITDYLSTADDEPEQEPEVFIQPKKKLLKKKEKATTKKISKTKEEEKAFAASFTGEEDEDPELNDNDDGGHIVIW
jgi:hypothetical protein